MRYGLLMRIASAFALTFGAYLLFYGSYCLWQYHVAFIPEAAEQDAHGMSRLVGYSFVLMLGVMVSGVGVMTWLARDVVDAEARQSITLGLFVLNAAAALCSLALEVTLWDTEWGKLHAAAFLLPAAAFGCYRLPRARYRHRARW